MDYWGGGGGGGGGQRVCCPPSQIIGGLGPPLPPSSYAYAPLYDLSAIRAYDTMIQSTVKLHWFEQ